MSQFMRESYVELVSMVCITLTSIRACISDAGIMQLQHTDLHTDQYTHGVAMSCYVLTLGIVLKNVKHKKNHEYESPKRTFSYSTDRIRSIFSS